jgi:hypothetical protein
LSFLAEPENSSRSCATASLLLSLGWGGSAAELERARQAEDETAKRLRECQEQLEETRKALEAARKAASEARGAEAEAAEAWKAARMTTISR